MPLTPYGKGGQKRSLIPLRDSMKCLTLALDNPPERGEYRVFNQFAETYSVFELAKIVQRVGKKLGCPVEITPLDPPRIEREEHYFNPDHEALAQLGYTPSTTVEKECEAIVQDLSRYTNRIKARKEAILPNIRWDGTMKRSKPAG